jgi:hypothetical protein
MTVVAAAVVVMFRNMFRMCIPVSMGLMVMSELSYGQCRYEDSQSDEHRYALPSVMSGLFFRYV